MTILFKSDKSLIITVPTKIHQRESAVDAFTFYCPTQYNEYDLSLFTPTIYYMNQANEARMEIMEWQESDKDGFLKIKLPITSQITQFVGDVKMYLSFTYNDVATNTMYVLKSDELTVHVLSINDYYAFVSDESLTAIDNRILELDTKIKEVEAITGSLDGIIPDDLMLTDDLLQLSIKGTPKGDGVNVVVNYEDPDGTHDGEIDLNVVEI